MFFLSFSQKAISNDRTGSDTHILAMEAADHQPARHVEDKENGT